MEKITKEMKEQIDELIELVEQLPCGVDYEADPEDTSPDDQMQHIAGLIWQGLIELRNEVK